MRSCKVVSSRALCDQRQTHGAVDILQRSRHVCNKLWVQRRCLKLEEVPERGPRGTRWEVGRSRALGVRVVTSPQRTTYEAVPIKVPSPR
jgi:hypothetical protein